MRVLHVKDPSTDIEVGVLGLYTRYLHLDSRVRWGLDPPNGYLYTRNDPVSLETSKLRS